MDRYKEEPEQRCKGCGEWHDRQELVNGFCSECLESEKEEIEMAVDQTLMSRKFKEEIFGYETS